MICSFTTFADEVRRKNLTPKDCGYNHWQILGGASLVNFYPSTKRGPRMYIDGLKSGSHRSVTVADAIAAASRPWAKSKGTKRRQLRPDLRRMQRETPEHDAQPDETRNRRDAMKADEFKGMLDDVTLLLTRACNDGRDKDITALSTIWNKLNQHRLEMVAAEAPSQCEHCEGASRADVVAIKKRLTEIEQKHQNLNRYYEAHMRSCHTSTSVRW